MPLKGSWGDREKSFMNYGVDKKRAPEINIKVIFKRIGFELSPLCLCLSLISVFKQQKPATICSGLSG
jgi:hypothetical protein